MENEDKRLFKPNNDSLLAKHLKLGGVNIYSWKRINIDKYRIIKRYWANRCNCDSDLEAINKLLQDNKLSPITDEHISIINQLIIKHTVLGR